MTHSLCRDCLWTTQGTATPARCPACNSPRLRGHDELASLAIAHIDCDAFYASIEKRDAPDLRDKPVIVGGGRRGVVSAACYIARRYGVRSAMPMFKARRACPQAVVIAPDMRKYAQVGRQVREILKSYTPLVEPLSLDEAFLDLSGTDRLHGGAPARTLALIVRRIEAEVGVSASIGLSYNKSLAKIASDLDKPRGFAVIGRAEARDFLAGQPVSIIWGAGRALQRKLAKDGIISVAQLQQMDQDELVARYGAMGLRMAQLARGVDPRQVTPNAPTKSVSSETTFADDIGDAEELDRILWQQCERVAARLKASGLAGGTVTLKLKTADFQIRTRSQSLPNPTQLADTIYRHCQRLLRREADGTRYRLLGAGVSQLVADAHADPLDLADPGAGQRAEAERALDRVRERFGSEAIRKGRGLARSGRSGRPGSG